MWWPEGFVMPAFYVCDGKIVTKLVFVAVIKNIKMTKSRSMRLVVHIQGGSCVC
jgi:hypothetical protein